MNTTFLLRKIYKTILIIIILLSLAGVIWFYDWALKDFNEAHKNSSINADLFNSGKWILDDTIKVKGTGSMLPTIQPDAVITYRPLNNEERILCGHIYMINLNNKSVIHRFVYESGTGQYYFKGDNNNLYDAPIQYDDIHYKPVAINLELRP